MLTIAPFLGLFIGGLVNNLADSLPSTRGLQRSHCHACGGPRPLVGWLALIGSLMGAAECAYCATRRRMRDFLVEFVAIFSVMGLAAYNDDPGYLFPTLLIGTIFLLIVVIDIEHRLILHIVTLPAAVVFFALSGINADLTYARSLIGGVFAFVLFLGLYLLGGLYGRWMAKRRGMDPDEVAFGFGDVTLATVIGFLLGFPAVIEALVRGILYAGVFSIGYMIYLSLRKRYSSFIPIPYGPFLIMGALWVYFQGWTTLERLVGLK